LARKPQYENVKNPIEEKALVKIGKWIMSGPHYEVLQQIYITMMITEAFYFIS